MKRILFMMFCLAFVLICGTLIASASEDVSVVVDENFPSQAPIATVKIDREKLTLDNLCRTVDGRVEKIDFPVDAQETDVDQVIISGRSNGFVVNRDGEVISRDAQVKRDGYTKLGNFTLIFKDAAVLSDGSTRNLEIIFDEIHTLGDSYPNSTLDILMGKVDSAGRFVSFCPKARNADNNRYFAVRSEMKFRVGKANEENEDESFFFAAGGIDTRNSYVCSNIVNEFGNENYSESIEPQYGISAYSDIYVPGSTQLEWNNGANTTANGYGYRFMSSDTSGSDFPGSDPVDQTLALVARAGGDGSNRINNGFITRVWGAAGPRVRDNRIDFFNSALTHYITSVSGAHGTIELNTAGEWKDDGSHVDNSRVLDTAGTKTYTVPNGKVVTYKMTPDEGYELKKVTVDGRPIDLTGDGFAKHVVQDSATGKNKVFYTYTFVDNEDHRIEVEYICPGCDSEKEEPKPKETPKVEQKPKETPKVEPASPKVSGVLFAKMTAKGKTSLDLGWNKIRGAAGYDIFLAECNHSGRKITCKKVKTVKGNKTFSWARKGLKKGTAYKAYVKAFVMKDGEKSYVRTSPLIHAYAGGSTKSFTNAKVVTVKKTKVTLQEGKSLQVKAKVKKLKKNRRLMPKSHAPALRYMTSDEKIATVSVAGKITAKGKGVCYVYVYAHNGVSKKVKVVVL